MQVPVWPGAGGLLDPAGSFPLGFSCTDVFASGACFFRGLDTSDGFGVDPGGHE